MWYVSGSRHYGLNPFVRQVLILTLVSHFHLMTSLCLQASANSLVMPEKLSRDPASSEEQKLFTVCLEQASRVGAGGKSPEDPRCARMALQFSSPHSRRQTSDGLMMAFARNHLLYVRKSAGPETSGYTQLLIAGRTTELGNVIALSLDSQHLEAAVIDEAHSASIQIYPVKRGGSMAYSRRLSHGSLKGIRDLAIDSQEDRVYAVNPDEPEVLVLNRLADDRHPDPARKNPILGRIRGNKTGLLMPTSVAVDAEGGRVIVLDAGRRQILVFDARQSGNVAPLFTIESASIAIGDPEYYSPVGYDAKTGMIETLGYDSGHAPVRLRFSIKKPGTVEPERLAAAALKKGA